MDSDDSREQSTRDERDSFMWIEETRKVPLLWAPYNKFGFYVECLAAYKLLCRLQAVTEVCNKHDRTNIQAPDSYNSQQFSQQSMNKI